MSSKDSATQSFAEDRFRAILEQSPFSIQIIAPDGRIIQVNKAWENLWGTTLAQIEGYNILKDEQLVRMGIMPYIERAFAGEAGEIPPKPYDPNETIPGVSRNDEPRRWTKAVIYPIKDVAGNVQEVVLMHEDITARVLAEEKMRASEERFRNLLENANDIIYSHDLEGKYLSINQAGELITGYTREEILNTGMNISQVVAPEYHEKARRMIAQKLQDPQPTVYEVEIIAKDGRRLTLEVSTRISFNEAGIPVAVEGVARDVTERKRVEHEKAQLAREVEAQKKHLQAMVASVPGVVWEAHGKPDERGQQIDFVSRHVEKMLGYSVEEWLATPNFWLTITHPDDREKAARTAAENYKNGSGINQFRWIARDGSVIWVETHSAVIYDEQGNPVGMRGVTMDITARKEREFGEKFLAEASAALGSSLEYETTLATVAKLAVPHFADWCAVDIAGPDGKLNRLAVAHVDPEKVKWAQEIYRSYPPDPAESRGVYNVFHTGTSEFYPEIPEELLVAGTRDEKHLQIVREIGLRSLMLVPLKARGKVLGVLTFVNTETGKSFTPNELKLAEDLAARAALAIDNAQLFRAERETRRAAERTSDFLRRLQAVSSSLSQALVPHEVAVAVVEQGVNSLGAHAGTVVQFNETTREVEIIGTVGFSEEVLKNWRNFNINARVPIADAILTKTPVLIESLDAYKDIYPSLGPLASITGTQALAAFPLLIEGQTIGALGLSFPRRQIFTDDDISFMLALAHQCAQALERARLYETEQRLREQAETVNRIKDEFLATVSHELRTPLNSIVGWSNLLVNKALDAENARRAVETISRNARAQQQIIEDLLDVSRIITGKLVLNPQAVVLEKIISTALESVRPTAATKNIKINSRFGSADEIIWGDPDRLQQIMWNLLSNAIKFTPNNGEINVSVEKNAALQEVRISVSDTGQGISPQFLPFVFDRFSQADGTSTRKFGGLGLGLAIVRHLIEMHGGSVKAESPGIDQGSTFVVVLPLRPAQSVNASDSSWQISVSPEDGENFAAAFQGLENIELLIVDDDADSLLLLKTIADNCGAKAVTANSVKTALEILQNFKPDVLISDIGMPEADGYTLIRKVRALYPDEKIQAIALTAYAREEDRRQALEAGFQRHLPKPFKPEELLEMIKELVDKNS